MAENFQDNISYGGSTLAVSGDAIAVGSTDAGAKSIIFNNTGSQGHLAWQPTDNRTVNIPDANGTIQLSGQAPGAIQAGTQTATSGTIIFSNSNGISFGMSNSSVVTASYTVPSTAGLISAINVSAGTTSNNLSAITFSNSNGLAFGLNGSTITGSYTVPSQTNQTVGLYALGNTTQNSSTTLDARTLSFNGLGIVTVGYSNGSIQISATTAQSAQTVGLYALGNTTQNSSTTLDARTLSFNGLGIVTVGYSNGSIQVSATTAAQTNQTVGLYALGNTTQNSSTTLDARTLSFNGLGAASVGYSNGSIQISVPNALTNINVSAGTTSNNLTALTFSNINGVSFGLNASTITASVAAQTNQTVGLYALGNTTQNSSTTFDARTLSFNGLGIITVGYSNGSIQLSATTTQTNQTVGLYAVGNTTQNSSTTLDARTLSFDGLGGATVGYSNGSVQISAPTTVGLISAINVSAGTTSNNLAALTFSNSNGISFGLNASTITASYTVPTQTNQTIGLYALGNTTQNSSTTLDARTLSFNGLGIITAGYSNGSIQLSATQSNQSLGFFATSNTTQNSSTTLDARSLTFVGAGVASVGYSNGSIIVSAPAAAADGVNIIAAGTQTANTTGTVIFSNSNNVTFGMSNSSIVTASVSQFIGLYALGNTTQNSSTTLNASALSFNGLGAITVGYSNGSIQLSAPASSSLSATGIVSISTNGSTISIGAVQSNQTLGFYAVSNTTQNSSTTLDARTLSFQGAGGVSVGYSNGSIVVSGGAGGGASTAGLYVTGNTIGQSSSSTFNQSSILFEGDGGISLGYSNGSMQISAPQTSSVVGVNGISISSNGSTVSISLIATSRDRASQLIWPENPWQTNFSISNASFSLQHFNPKLDIVATQANLLMNLTGNSNSSGALTISLGIYTMSGSTMSLASSNSQQISWTSNSQTSASSRYGGVSGTRYRTAALGSWSITAGDYMLGMWFRTTNNGTWQVYGVQGPQIVGAVDANETNAYLNGFSTSSFTTAMVVSVNVTDTNYVRTSGVALQQPSIIFLGTF